VKIWQIDANGPVFKRGLDRQDDPKARIRHLICSRSFNIGIRQMFLALEIPAVLEGDNH
jgi:hypothetical protein